MLAGVCSQDILSAHGAASPVFRTRTGHAVHDDTGRRVGPSLILRNRPARQPTDAAARLWRRRYPTPRTVWIRSAPWPSLRRTDLM